MNPVVALIALRLGFFVLPLGVLALLGVPTPVALGTAAVLSVVLSALFLRGQRERVGQLITSHINSRPSFRRRGDDSRRG